MKKLAGILTFFILFILFLVSCTKEVVENVADRIEIIVPNGFPEFVQPANNPITVQGFELGRMLFYDPILSSDSTIACASCHNPSYSFADNKKYSLGVNGAIGDMQSMALINLAWQKKFFWNGRANSLEEQALGPINNPVEMHETSENVVKKLKAHKGYPKLFRSAFGTDIITPELIAKALAQFERRLISHNSKFDGYIDSATKVFTDVLEFEGFQIFFNERGQCFHCHGGGGTFLAHNLDTTFRNNGLLTNSQMQGKGLFQVTGQLNDQGKFKVPTLRNIELTGPYMHDGRFTTLEQVVEFYSSGIQQNENLDINFTKNQDRLDQYGGLGLSTREKQALVMFMKTFTDTSYINNPLFKNPFH